MKKNNKGFMLVEVIIVTVVVASIMTSLFVVFNRVYNAYDKLATYSDVDAIYALKMIEDYMIEDMSLNGKIRTTSTYSEIIPPDELGFIYRVFLEYKINKLYLVKLTTDSKIGNIEGINQTFKDYINYLNNAVVDNSMSYLFIVETYSDSSDQNINNKYAYLPIKIN